MSTAVVGIFECERCFVGRTKARETVKARRVLSCPPSFHPLGIHFSGGDFTVELFKAIAETFQLGALAYEFVLRNTEAAGLEQRQGRQAKSTLFVVGAELSTYSGNFVHVDDDSGA
jgi:hypothetical protein